LRWLILIFSLTSVLAAFLNIKKLKVCFIIWTIANLGQISVILFYKVVGFYGQLPLWIVFSLLNIYGYYEWRKEEGKFSKIRLCKFGFHSWIKTTIKSNNATSIIKSCRFCPKEVKKDYSTLYKSL